MSHYKSTTSIEVGILGENVDDWKDGLAHAAKWCRDTAHVLKAHPSLADVALVVTQYTAPGALKTLNTLLRGIGKDEVSEEYPESLNLTAATTAAITARRQFHEQWLAEMLAACSVDEQLPLIRQVDEHPFPAAPQGSAYSLREIAPYTAWLQNLFATLDPEVRDRLKGNAEIRDAVYRKIPVEIRHLIKNIRDHDDADFEDTWETICERLTEQAHLSQKAAPAVRAFSAHLNKKPRRDDIVASPQIQKQRNLNTPSYEATFLTATMAPENARSSIWRRYVSDELGMSFPRPIELEVDNQTAIMFSKDTVRRSKLRHIDSRQSWVEALRDNRIVEFVKVHTDENLADMNSKLLGAPRFLYLRDKLMVSRNIPEEGEEKSGDGKPRANSSE